ncbi:MAG: ankyrin repeat domain-containing protein [Candidatus Babeliales bacterium]
MSILLALPTSVHAGNPENFQNLEKHINQAIEHGDTTQLQQLIITIPPENLDACIQNSFKKAIALQQWEIIERLVEFSPALLRLCDQDGLTIFNYATSFGQKKLFCHCCKLLRKHYGNMAPPISIHTLIAFEDLETIQEHSEEKNFNFNAPGPHGKSLLHTAVSSKKQRIVEYLLAKGADCNARDNYGFSPLHIAARFGPLDILKCLIACETIDINATNKKKATALHYAMDPEIAQILLDAGASLEARTNDQCTPLHKAAKDGNIPLLEFLLKAGAAVTAVEQFGYTALHWAAIYGHKECTRILAAYPEILNQGLINSTFSPLHLAVRDNHYDTAQILLQAGAKVDNYDYQNRTPLHHAVIKNDTKMIKLLLAHGATPSKQDKEALSPLGLAHETGKSNLATLLKDAHMHPEKYITRKKTDAPSLAISPPQDRSPSKLATIKNFLNTYTILSPTSKEGDLKEPLLTQPQEDDEAIAASPYMLGIILPQKTNTLDDFFAMHQECFAPDIDEPFKASIKYATANFSSKQINRLVATIVSLATGKYPIGYHSSEPLKILPIHIEDAVNSIKNDKR